MATYTFKCEHCNVRLTDKTRRFGDNTPPKCEQCEHTMVQVIDRPEFKLMGKGWYKPGHFE